MAFTSYDAAVHTIERAGGLLAGARPTVLGRNPQRGLFRRATTVAPEVRGDMRRLSVVMAVSALDTYMPRLILERSFTHDQLPKKPAQLDVNFEQLLAQADATRAAARAKPFKPRPRVSVKRQLQERLLRETFQTYNAVSQALNMAGRPKEWSAIGAKMSLVQKPEEIKQRLDGIVHRPNKIVHRVTTGDSKSRKRRS